MSTTAAETMPIAPPGDTETVLPLELVELELALDGIDIGNAGFAETVGDVARRSGGEFLFDLPASGLAENCRQIAALRLPSDDDNGYRIVFALLDETSTAVRIEEPGEATEGLKNFAEAFVTVIETLNAAKAA